MTTYADKSQDQKSQIVSNSETLVQSDGEATFQLEDNRPETVVQRKLQEMANNSPRILQLRAIHDMTNSRFESKNSTQIEQQTKIGDQNSEVVQRYNFRDDVENDDWDKLNSKLEPQIASYAGVIDVDMDHIKKLHIDESDDKTHFNLNYLDVLTLIKTALMKPSIRWVKDGSITIEQDTGAIIGTNGETKIRIFVSTKAMDNAGDWQDAWVTTAYPF